MTAAGYSRYDGRWVGGYRDPLPKPRSMKEIKADYNRNLQKHSIPVDKRQF